MNFRNSIIKTVIFDLDGLLVNSEPLHYLTDKTHYKLYGCKFTLATQREFTGKRVIDQTIALKKRFRLKPSVNDLLKERSSIFKNLIREKLKLSSGAFKLIIFLSLRKIPLAIGTSAEDWYVNFVLKKFNLAKFFKVVVNGNQIKYSKPNPEVYLKVSQKLGIPPKSCLVLEDAVSGVMAAKKAGMFCFAIPNYYSNNSDYLIADRIFSSLTRIKTYLKKDYESL